MQHAIVPLALSVALVALTGTPAAAQMRRSAPTAAPAATAQAPSRPTTDFRIFIGPAFEGGSRSLFKTRTSGTSTAPTAAPAGASFTAASSGSTSVEQTEVGNGVGVMYGAEGTWWGADRLGLGASLFGAYVGGGAATNILPPDKLPTIKTDGGNTITPTETTTLNGTGYSVGMTPTPSGGGLANLSFNGWTTLPGVGGTSFLLQSGTETGANPDTYSSTGGVSYSLNRTVWLNEVGVHGAYRLVEAPSGGVSFFGGFTFPTAFMSQTYTAKTVGANGQGTVATQTQNADEGGGATYVQKTEYELNETTRSDSSVMAFGPMIGLDAYYNLNPSTRLYTRLGYAPVLVGTATGTSVKTVNDRVSVIVDNVQGTPAGATAGTRRWENQVSTPGAPTVTSISGAETAGSIGVGFGFAGYNLFAEGTARSYSLGGAMGPELLYGLKLGLNFGF